MPESNVNRNLIEADLIPSQVSSKDIEVDNEVLRFQRFLNHIIEHGIKGRHEVRQAAKSFSINKSYSSILSKLKIYKEKGVGSLTRKEKSDKGTAKSFSNGVLLRLQKIYNSPTGGCAIRAYEDTHKYFRNISREFIVTATGEALAVLNGYLCDVENNQILSQYTTKFIPGIYVLKPEAITSGECEVSIGSYASAARFLKTIKNTSADEIFMQRMGIHDYRNKRQHTMKLDYSRREPSEMITGDGKLVDLLVISDDWRKVYRPWLMGWEDAATRRFCYQVSLSETSEAIANSLTVAVTKWGIPKLCKHDNGQAYRSGRFDQMKQSLSIKTHRVTVKLARGKMIESFWNILDQMLKTQIGYTGNKREEFPQDTRNRLKFVLGQQKDIKDAEKMFKEQNSYDYNFVNIANPEARLKSSKKRFMHISEFIELLEDKIEEYHERKHGGLEKDELGKQVYNVNCKDELINSLGEKLNSPRGRYEYKVALGFKPVMANAETVGIYAMNFELRTVQLKTGISFNNEEYYSPKLRSLAGQRILIRYTHPKTDMIYVFHSEELQKVGSDKKYIPQEIISSLKYVCLAELQKAIHYGDSSFKDALLLQREEERKLIASFANKPESNILALSAMDSQISTIKKDEENFSILKFNKLKPRKVRSIFDD